MGCYNYTVDSFLEAAGTHRRQKGNAQPGRTWDHIVELQLVVAAVNSLLMPYQYIGWQRELATFFQRDSNFQSLSPGENQAKGMAVKRRIAGTVAQGDEYWVQQVRNRWVYGALTELQNEYGNRHIAFIQAMNLL